jgi:hypothetical protein
MISFWPSMHLAWTFSRTSTLWPARSATSVAGTPELSQSDIAACLRSYGRRARGESTRSGDNPVHACVGPDPTVRGGADDLPSPYVLLPRSADEDVDVDTRGRGPNSQAGKTVAHLRTDAGQVEFFAEGGQGA